MLATETSALATMQPTNASSMVDWTVSDRSYQGEPRFTHIKTIDKIDLLTE
jgi:hypothetical protein